MSFRAAFMRFFTPASMIFGPTETSPHFAVSEMEKRIPAMPFSFIKSTMSFSSCRHSKWGDVSVGPKIVDAGVKKRMKAALKDIQTGKFAKEWVKEYKGGYKKYNALLKKDEQHAIEKTGERLRGLMPWMPKRNIKGAQAAY